MTFINKKSPRIQLRKRGFALRQKGDFKRRNIQTHQKAIRKKATAYFC